jgi:hypothetical protein
LGRAVKLLGVGQTHGAGAIRKRDRTLTLRGLNKASIVSGDRDSGLQGIERWGLSHRGYPVALVSR